MDFEHFRSPCAYNTTERDRVVPLRGTFLRKMFLMAEHILGSELKAFRKSLRMTQQEMASMLGVTRSAYANHEAGQNNVPESYLPVLRRLGFNVSNVSAPSIAVPEFLIPIPFVGLVNADTPATWAAPNDSDSLEFVPAEMGNPKGRFAARVESDCMYPLLQPDDIVVLHQHSVPRIGTIVLFRTFDNRDTLKQLKHDGEQYILHALNPKVPDRVAEGTVVGYLVGIVRQVGRRRYTDYDPDGIRP